MKISIRILSSLFLLALPACVSNMPELSFGSGVGAPKGFYGHLSNEYKNLASYEEEFMQHADDALHFTTKARKVLKHQDVLPDLPESRNIPDFAVEELTNAYSSLTDALETLQMDDNEALLAMAQTRYDCWLAHQEDFPVKDAYIFCKSEFYNTLALLNIPEADNVVHSIHFESGAIALNKEERQIVGDIAARYRDRPHWRVVLKGFTDSKGDKRQNKILSMRRAVAVKNTLGQYGMDLDNIAIGAEGEVSASDEGEADSSHSRRVEIRVRQDYVAKNKKGLTVAPGWRHSGGV